MPNWITINNIAGDTGEALINLDSGMVVQRVHEQLDEHLKPDCSVTKIWSLNNNERYLQGSPELYDKVKLVYKNSAADVREICSCLNDIALNIATS